MSMVIDYKSLKDIESKYELLVSGYIHQEFNQSKDHSQSNPISQTILAFYHEECDEFTSFFGPHDISEDKKCFSGCGYGDIEIDPNDKRYNHYQWIINMNHCRGYSEGVLLGITSIADTNMAWFKNKQLIHYTFTSTQYYLPQVDEENYGDAFRNDWFQTKDIILLDLDLEKKQFKLYINGKCRGIRKNIKCDTDITYKLGVMVFDGHNYVTIEKFKRFNHNKICESDEGLRDLLNDKTIISTRTHPNGELYYDYDLLREGTGEGIEMDHKIICYYRRFNPHAWVDQNWWSLKPYYMSFD